MAITIPLPDLSATEAFAACIAPHLGRGDTVLLSGEIGAGKTSFVRAVIRSRLGPGTEVPSPTYTLVQTYEDAGVEIWHSDLYRLGEPGELVELGLIDALSEAICLIEWPDRMGQDIPVDALSLAFDAGTTAHSVTATGPATWMARIGGCLA